MQNIFCKPIGPTEMIISFWINGPENFYYIGMIVAPLDYYPWVKTCP